MVLKAPTLLNYSFVNSLSCPQLMTPKVHCLPRLPLQPHLQRRPKFSLKAFHVDLMSPSLSEYEAEWGQSAPLQPTSLC